MREIPTVIGVYIAGLKSHDVNNIAETVSADLAFVTPTRELNKDEFLQMLRALYAGFPDWHYDHDAPEWLGSEIAVKWRQQGTHTQTFEFPGLGSISATRRSVKIPEHYFFYKVRGDEIVRIRPDPVPGAAPGGILEQIGVRAPPL